MSDEDLEEALAPLNLRGITLRKVHLALAEVRAPNRGWVEAAMDAGMFLKQRTNGTLAASVGLTSQFAAQQNARLLAARSQLFERVSKVTDSTSQRADMSAACSLCVGTCRTGLRHASEVLQCLRRLAPSRPASATSEWL